MLSLEPDELHYGWAGQRCLSLPTSPTPPALPELWQDLSASGDQDMVAPVKGKTNRLAAKEEQTRRAGPWPANRLEVRQTHFCSDMNPDLQCSSSTSYLALAAKAAQSARASVLPAIYPTAKKKKKKCTAAALARFCNSVPLSCGRLVQSASALRGLFARRRPRRTQAKVCAWCL